jgi:predicted lipase
MSASKGVEMTYTDADIATMCEQVYREEDELKKLGFKFIDIRETDTQAIVKETFKNIIICFRGTESVHDAVQDLKFKNRTSTGIHRGFSEAFSSAEREISKHILELGTRELVLCGHSLGGALAILAFAHYSKNHEKTRCVTFGCPRVFGSEAFSNTESPGYQLAQDRITRYVQPRDPVTYVPPWLKGYRHVGIPVTLKLNQPDPEGTNWFMSFFKSTASRHSMVRYVENMKGR